MPLLATSDYKKIKQNFFEELKAASQSKQASISFFKHTLPEEPLITNGIVQGIVIGGTNYIVATEEIENGRTKNVIQKTSGVLPIMDDARIFKKFFTYLFMIVK